MIKKYSLYFANTAAIVVFVFGIVQNISFVSLVVRTVVAFFGFYFLGIILGVLTVETLLDSQIKKIEQRRERKKAEKENKEV